MDSRQTVIITGGNAGLGLETARRITQDRSRLIVIACRNPALGADAAVRLRTLGSEVLLFPLDLADQESVHRFAEEVLSADLPPLHAIVCNAGMQNVGTPQRTNQGYETTFAVNHLGHYLLVRLLLDHLQAGARITLVSSGTHDPKANTRIPAPVYQDAQSIAHDFAATRGDGLRRYATSKLCNLLFAYELQRRLQASGDSRLSSILVNALNPGLMANTGLARTWPKPIQLISRILLPLTTKDAQTPETSGERLAALTVGDEAFPGGRYFSGGRPTASSEDSYNRAFQHELWVSSARMTALPPDLGR